MDLRVGIVGIGGSEKQLLTGALADVVAAELQLRVAVVEGADVWYKTQEEDVLLPGFAPDGVFMSMRLSLLCQRGAIALVRWPRLSTLLTLAQWFAQERIIQRIRATYQPDVIFSDGSLVISLIRQTLSRLGSQTTPGDYVVAGEALLAYMMHGRALPAYVACSIPNLIRHLCNLNRRLRLGLLKLPDALIFLESTIEPASGSRPIPHKSVQTQDVMQLQMFVNLFRKWQGERNVVCIDNTGHSKGYMLARTIDSIRTLVHHDQPTSSRVQERLGVTNQDLSQGSTVAKKVFTYRYLIRYTLLNLHRGSLHELTFPLSPFGRFFLREGYSATVMKAIYTQDKSRQAFLNQVFFRYPLHQAIFHRQHLLGNELERELEQRASSKQIRILFAPSGYAVDLLQALKRLTRASQEKLTSIHIVTSDIDPDGKVETELRQTIPAVGCDLTFLRGDITSSEIQSQFERFGPYDVVIFVGISSWMSKSDLVGYLTFVRTRLLLPGEQSSVFFTDCFTPHAFALSGKYFGYRASYYYPGEFSDLLTYCGFSSTPTALIWSSDPTGINHLCIARIAEWVVQCDFNG